MKPTYRLKPFDLANDIWILQKRFLFVLWRSVGVGSKAKLEAVIKLAELMKA